MNPWKKHTRLPSVSPWFHIYRLDNGVTALYEPYHFQEVISYLIEGENQCLLWDTGMGLADIQAEVRQLTPKPLLVMNSHVHFDHVGDNHRFEEVMVLEDAGASSRLQRGYSVQEMEPHTHPDLFQPQSLAWARREGYCIPPCKPRPISPGFQLDLGGRVLEVIHTPGHSPESIMLLDKTYGELFAGDSYYPGHLYAHFDGDFYRASNLRQYARSMAAMAARREEFSVVHPSHNAPCAEPEVLQLVAACLGKIADGQAQAYMRPLEDPHLASLPAEEGDNQGYQNAQNLKLYDFGNLRIITQ